MFESSTFGIIANESKGNASLVSKKKRKDKYDLYLKDTTSLILKILNNSLKIEEKLLEKLKNVLSV